MTETKADGIPPLLKKYFDNETFSDAVVQCDGKEFKVHRLVLSAYSGFFEKMFNGSWKESKEAVAKFEDVDASVVEVALQFMYTSEYNNTYGISTMGFHAQVYGFADKYDIPDLKVHALKKFKAAIGSGWAMEDFPSAISEVFTTTPDTDRGLRDLVMQTCRNNVDKLLEQKAFCEVLRETPGFASDLVLFRCYSQKTRMDTYQCPSCGNSFQAKFDDGQYYYCQHCGSRRTWQSCKT